MGHTWDECCPSPPLPCTDASLQPYLDQIDQIHTSVAALEQTAYRLDAYTKQLGECVARQQAERDSRHLMQQLRATFDQVLVL